MENKNIMVGRHYKVALLQKIINSSKAELVAVYGRKRVGKTYLIDKTFATKYDFYTTGIYEGARKEQLTNFANQLNIYAKKKYKVPKDWMAAFLMLREYIKTLLDKKGLDIFIDKLPWFYTPRSISEDYLFFSGMVGPRNRI